jgi:hypothetical protein
MNITGADIEIAAILRWLHRAGWSVGGTAVDYPEGRVWLVSGHKGENLIRAEGATEVEAWRDAESQGRAHAMIPRSQ